MPSLLAWNKASLVALPAESVVGLGFALSVLAIEVLAERIEALTEESREFVDPMDHILQRLRVQAIQSLAAVTADRDELCLSEDAQMLRDRV